jgi:hypothetical protein
MSVVYGISYTRVSSASESLALPEQVVTSIARLHLQGADARTRPCTGFLLSSQVLLTCQHCVSDDSDCSQMVAEVGVGAGAGALRSRQARCRKLLRTSSWDDLAFVELEWPTGGAASLPTGIPLSARPIAMGASILIAGFPGSASQDPRELVLASGRTLRPMTPAPTPLLFHDAPSSPGHSGSPVLDASTLEAAGIHCASTEFHGARRSYGAGAAKIREAQREPLPLAQ